LAAPLELSQAGEIDVGDDSTPEHHYWIIEKNYLFENELDSSELVEFEEWLGGTLIEKEKIDETISNVHERALSNGYI